jgi:enoyl-[acyl-carrier protein] reductase II
LAQEILPAVREVPIFVAGGLGRGDMIANYLLQGAAGAQLGTRFVCAQECVAHPAFKQAFLRGHARDAIASVQLDPRFPVIPVRALKNKGTEEFMQTQRDIMAQVDAGALDLASGQLAIEHYWAGALRRAVVEGDVETGSLMAGQSVGLVTREQPACDIIADLVSQACDLLEFATSAKGVAP